MRAANRTDFSSCQPSWPDCTKVCASPRPLTFPALSVWRVGGRAPLCAIKSFLFAQTRHAEASYAPSPYWIVWI